jgi:hypothetical protein
MGGISFNIGKTIIAAITANVTAAKINHVPYMAFAEYPPCHNLFSGSWDNPTRG